MFSYLRFDKRLKPFNFNFSEKYYLVIFGLTFFLSCGQKSNDFDEASRIIEQNKSKFYYPEAHDDFWSHYKPNLVGSEGWIEENCEGTRNGGEKVIITYQSLNHKGWGNFEGRLNVEIIETGGKAIIDFDCFRPDYNKGEWLR